MRPSPGDHVRHHGARDVEHATDVRIQHGADVLVAQQRQQVVAHDAGVVDQHVDAPAAGDDLLDRRCDRSGVRDVDLHRLGLAAGQCHCADDVARSLGVAAVKEDDVDAIAREPFDDGAADAAAAAGDQRDFAGESGVGCLHACHPVQPEMANPPSTKSVWPLIMAASGRHSR